MAKFKKGDQVAQVITPVRGEVIGFQVDQETGDLQVAVTWPDDGGMHTRYFKEDEIALIPASATPESA